MNRRRYYYFTVRQIPFFVKLMKFLLCNKAVLLPKQTIIKLLDVFSANFLIILRTKLSFCTATFRQIKPDLF